MLLQQFCGSSAISAYAARIFDTAGFPSDIGTSILAVILVPQSIIVMFAVDRCGRRPLLMVIISLPSLYIICVIDFPR
jgi:hypothetical protein